MEGPVHHLAADDASNVAVEAARWGALILRLGTVGATSMTGFFACVRDQLPLDPPLHGPPLGTNSWDAMADSLWEGIFQLEARNVFLVWEGSASLRDAAPSECEQAEDVFEQIARTLADDAYTAGQPRNLQILVVD